MTRTAFKSALEDIFSVPRGSLNDSDTRDTVEGWSSLADVSIVTFVSSQFGIDPDVELLEAESVGDLLHLLQEREVITA
jgi:acyl carrier protein